MQAGLIRSVPSVLDDITVRSLAGLVRRQLWVFAVVLAVFLGLAVAYLQNATYEYTVGMWVAPAQGGTESNLGQYASLASSAGIELPTGDNGSQFKLYQKALTSLGAAQQLARDRSLMRRLFAEEWSPVEQRWVEPQSMLSGVAATAKALVGVPVAAWRPPDALRLQKYLSDKLKLDEDKKSPVVTVAIEIPDPQLGVELLGKLHETVDRMLQRRTLQRSDAAIAYLTYQLRIVTLAEHRAAIAQILIEQEKTRMLARSTLAYAADVFDVPSRSARPTNPQPLLILGLAFVAGLLLAIAVALLRDNGPREAVPVEVF